MLQALETSIPLSPLGLVQDCLAGDEAAWRRLYDDHRMAVHRILLRMGVPASQVDDSRQEVFLVAFKYLSGFRGECAIRTWLYRICASEARRVRQKNRLRGAVQSFFGLSPLLEGTAFQEPTDHQSEALLQRALGALPVGERDVFVLFELEGLPGCEIAAVLEIPEATVWRRLHYGRARFRAALGEPKEE